MKFCGYDVHPAANLFPMMTEDEFDELAEDIREHGQILPIILHEGKILDGRNRAMACHRLGRAPKVETLVCDDPISWAISANAKRRNLSKTQLAAVAAESLALYEAEAKERIRNAQAVRHGVTVEKIPQIEQGKARDKAAKAAGVNPRYVQDAKKIKEDAPEVFEQMKANEISLQDAKRKVFETAHISVPAIDPADDEGSDDQLFHLKRHWKAATKKTRKAFLAWVKSNDKK